MSDQQLREIERRAASGDLDAQAQLLLERYRTGNLQDDRLRVLAQLGDPQARMVLGGKEWPEPIRDPGELMASLRPSANRWLILRAVLAVARHGVEVWEEHVPDDTRARDTHLAARRWLEALQDGREDASLEGRAWQCSTALRRAAMDQDAAARAAGRGVSEPVITFRATGGRFLASAEVVASLMLKAGVSSEQVCATILDHARQQLLDATW